MRMRLLGVLSLSLLATGCAGTIQTASISEAYKKYEKQDYKETLMLISRAENAQEMHAEQKAEMTYLKARTYEALGETGLARTLYEYLREQHPESQYGYLADRMLSATMSAAPASRFIRKGSK